MVNTTSSEKDRKGILEEVEWVIKGGLVKKDEIGVCTLVHDLWEKRGNNNFYVISYYFKADQQILESIKKALLYNKVVYRYFIFGMNTSDEMFELKTIQDEMNGILEKWIEKKVWPKVSFFANADNKKYITWKAIPMLKKYMTRFGNVKPRKYTGNSVSVQKKLRSTIIRAREMWFLEYIK